jgi:multidrug efflux system membrane fusion protein
MTLMMVWLAGCNRPPAPPPPQPPTVSVAQPLTQEVVEWDEFIGRLEAVESVEVRARVSGLLESVHFTDGQLIKQGDVLFVIDPRPFQAELDRAAADVTRAQADLQRAAEEAQRAEQAGGALPQEEVVRRQIAVQQATASLAAAQAQRAAAQLNVEFATVRAPISGRISRRLITPGNLITGGTAQGTLLTTIASQNPIYCYVDTDERTVQKYVRMAQEGRRQTARQARIPAYAALASEDSFHHEGYIDFVDNRLNPETGTLQARAVFQNTDETLIPGYFARLRVPGSSRYQATLLPETAIGTDQDRRFVMVVGDDGKAAYRPVTLGASFGGMRAIISGVLPTDKVIVNGLQRVRPGVPVTATTVTLQPPDVLQQRPGQGQAVAQPAAATQPVTQPATQASPPPVTRPATSPVTRPATQPATSPSVSLSRE